MMYNASVACENILNVPKETDGQLTTCTYDDDAIVLVVISVRATQLLKRATEDFYTRSDRVCGINLDLEISDTHQRGHG